MKNKNKRNGDPFCKATIIARRDAFDQGKWRRCELPQGHSGLHETTYCGKAFSWPKPGCGKRIVVGKGEG